MPADASEPFVLAPSAVFSPDECAALIDLARSREPVERPGDTGDRRSARTCWWNVLIDAESGCAAAGAAVMRVAPIIDAVNLEHFGFILDELKYVLVYEYGPGHGIQWHADRTERPWLKLSSTILLSDPGDYTGGALELLCDGTARRLPDRQGRLVAWPSWATHRVTPVASGTRTSLIALASGASFM